MNFETFLLILLGVGALGGVVNCILNGGFHLPKQEAGIWNPGWMGTVFVGIMTSVVVGLGNPPLSTLDISRRPEMPAISLNFIVTALVAAIGGSKILLLIVDKKADELSKQQLQQAVKNLTP